MMMWTWTQIQKVFSGVMDRHDEIAHGIRSWDGSVTNFDQTVGQSVESAVEEAIGTRTATALYVAWSAVVEVDRNQRRSGGRGIGRGLALDLWDRMNAQRNVLREAVREWEHAECVLLDTVHSCWDGLLRLLEATPKNENDWLRAVDDAVISATGQLAEVHGDAITGKADTSATENLMALLDLGARVFGADGTPGNAVPSQLGAWRRVMAREAAELARRAVCQDVPVLERSQSTRVNENLARFFLCVYADSIEPIESDCRLRELAARMVGGVDDSDAAAAQMEWLLRHFAFENELFAVLLQERVKYRPFGTGGRSMPDVPRIEFIKDLDRLDQKLLLLGPTAVGKSSFIFASEALTDSPSSIHPKVELEHANSDVLGSAQEAWRAGRLEPTDHFDLTARVNPFGLCSFQIADPRGESVIGVETRYGKSHYRDLQGHIERLCPSALVLMLSPEIADGDATGPMVDRLDVMRGLDRALFHLSGLEYLKDWKRRESFPVYLVVNKTDQFLDEYRKKGATEQRLAELRDGLREGGFALHRYFAETFHGAPRPGHPDETLTVDSSDILARLLDDPALTGNIAVRKLIDRTLRDWLELVATLGRRGFWNTSLVFISSLFGTDAGPGVGAFWSGFCGDRAIGSFAEGLKDYAERVFVTRLGENVGSVKGLAEPEKGLRLVGAPEVDTGDVEREFQKLAAGGADRVVRNGDASGDFMGEIDEHSREGKAIKNLEREFEERATKFRKRCDKLVGRLIRELNVDPSRKCREFLAPDPASVEELKWLKEVDHDEPAITHAVNAARDFLIAVGDGASIGAVENAPLAPCSVEEWKAGRPGKDGRRSNLHPYFGALRDGSICRNRDESVLFPDVQEWLRSGGGGSVGNTLEAQVVNFLSTAEPTGSARPSESLPEVVQDVLWFVSDQGCEVDDRSELNPDYGRLTLRRGETDSFRVRSLVGEAVDCGRRIGDVVRLLGQLYTVRANMPDHDDVRAAVHGWLYAQVLSAMGFDVGEMHERAHSELVQRFEEGESELEKLVKAGWRGPKWWRNRRTDLKRAMKSVMPFVNGMERLLGGRIGSAEIAKVWDRVSFAAQVVGDAGRHENLMLTPQERNQRAQELQGDLQHAVDGFNDHLDNYVESTCKLLMLVHWHYLHAGGFFAGSREDVSGGVLHGIRAGFRPVPGMAGVQRPDEIVDRGFGNIIRQLTEV